jgi:DNA-binding IclR family transcriptional regulator
MKKKVRKAEAAGALGETRYRAPALEKGLDILELLSQESDPMPLAVIVQRLDRSMGELFRMMQVLEHRGFIEQEPSNGGYRLTDKLFALGMHLPAVRTIVEIALPRMRQLSMDIGQSCHLAFHSDGQHVVVARMESSELIGFSVRIGYRQPLTGTVSGIVLYAWQPEATRRRWESLFRPALGRDQLELFRDRADRVRKAGFERQASRFVSGVTDISAPILRDSIAAAALTVPFLETISVVKETTSVVKETTPVVKSINDSIELVVRCARIISSALLSNDQRV